jgi:hypothetical protein
MASDSYFSVYFRGASTLDDAERRLRKSKLTAKRVRNTLVVRWGKGPELTMGLSAEAHVVVEAFEVGAVLQDLTTGYLHYAWNGNIILPGGSPCTCSACS